MYAHPSPTAHLNCNGRMLDFSQAPFIMAIANTTPDSFFDGGRSPAKALDHAMSLIEAGADILDIGGESTRPGAIKVSPEEEMERTLPLLEAVVARSPVTISIDTYKAEVADAALQLGAHIVNDISAFALDPDMPSICARHKAGVVLMHASKHPDEMQWSTDTRSGMQDIVDSVATSLQYSLEEARRHGITSIILDPGFGFGKSVEENFTLLRRLGELHKLGCPLLAGLSRKSFLGAAITRENMNQVPPSARLTATISANTIALCNGAGILRVHDVSEAVETRAVVRKAFPTAGNQKTSPDQIRFL